MLAEFLSKLGLVQAPSSCLVVLLIDMQNRFFERLGEDVREKLVAQQIKVIHVCAERDIPLILIEYQGYGWTIDALAHEVAMVPRHVVVMKGCDDAFVGTSLHKTLRDFSANKLVLMGTNASLCVRDTAKSAVSKGYEIVTADDVIADEAGCGGREKSRQWYEANGLFLSSLDMETLGT